MDIPEQYRGLPWKLRQPHEGPGDLRPDLLTGYCMGPNKNLRMADLVRKGLGAHIPQFEITAAPKSVLLMINGVLDFLPVGFEPPTQAALECFYGLEKGINCPGFARYPHSEGLDNSDGLVLQEFVSQLFGKTSTEMEIIGPPRIVKSMDRSTGEPYFTNLSAKVRFTPKHIKDWIRMAPLVKKKTEGIQDQIKDNLPKSTLHICLPYTDGGLIPMPDLSENETSLLPNALFQRLLLKIASHQLFPWDKFNSAFAGAGVSAKESRLAHQWADGLRDPVVGTCWLYRDSSFKPGGNMDKIGSFALFSNLLVACWSHIWIAHQNNYFKSEDYQRDLVAIHAMLLTAAANMVMLPSLYGLTTNEEDIG